MVDLGIINTDVFTYFPNTENLFFKKKNLGHHNLLFDIRSVQPSTVAVWKTLSSASDTIWWTYGEDCFLVPSSTSGEKDSKRWNVKLELCYWPWIVPPIVLYHCDGANINKNSTAFLFFKENQIGKSYYSIWSSDVFQDDWIIKQPYCFLQCKTFLNV